MTTNRKREILLTLGCVLAVSLTAGANLRSGAPLRREFDNWSRARATRKILKQNWPTLTASEDRLGNQTADVRGVIFLDFQCPVCVAEWPRLDSVLAGHPEVAIAVRHLPLSFHPAAEPAARAAICAGRQGKFEAIASRLLSSTKWHDSPDWVHEAQAVAVPDLTAFQKCLNAPSTLGRLHNDTAFARQLGIAGTPTFVFQGEVRPGIMSRDQLDQMLLSSSGSKR